MGERVKDLMTRKNCPKERSNIQIGKKTNRQKKHSTTENNFDQKTNTYTVRKTKRKKRRVQYDTNLFLNLQRRHLREKL